MINTKHLKIFGQVQGVGFRYSMLSAAHRFGIKGWVKNCPDGTVEAVVQGSSEQINNIIEWAKKGPAMSDVDHVEITEAVGQFHEFKITS